MRVEDQFVSATILEQDEPELVARTTDEFKAAAERDHQGGVPRGRAYVRRLQELTVEHPALGIAVAAPSGWSTSSKS